MSVVVVIKEFDVTLKFEGGCTAWKILSELRSGFNCFGGSLVPIRDADESDDGWCQSPAVITDHTEIHIDMVLFEGLYRFIDYFEGEVTVFLNRCHTPDGFVLYFFKLFLTVDYDFQEVEQYGAIKGGSFCVGTSLNFSLTHLSYISEPLLSWTLNPFAWCFSPVAAPFSGELSEQNKDTATCSDAEIMDYIDPTTQSCGLHTMFQGCEDDPFWRAPALTSTKETGMISRHFFNGNFS